MKIEKISDNQIRCILTEEDLEEHQLKISELALGSNRSRELFKDMMAQAFDEVGFEAENTPLMIEAVPLNEGCIVLVVTKVDDPQVIEERFKNIPKLHLNGDEDDDDFYDTLDDDYDDDDDQEGNNGILDVDVNIGIDIDGLSEEEQPKFTEEDKKALLDSAMDLIAPFTKALAKAKEEALKKSGAISTTDLDKNDTSAKNDASANSKKSKKKSTDEKKTLHPEQHFVFDSLDRVTEYSILVAPFYLGESKLYKELSSNLYYLTLNRYNSDEDAYARACHIASDFATNLQAPYTAQAYMDEHFICILKEQAIETLVSL